MQGLVRRVCTTIILIGALLGGSAWAQQGKMPMHPAHANVPCATCHGTGGAQKDPVTTATCLKCHGSYAQVAKATATLKVNPHDSHKGQPACSSCHSMHGQSVLSCNDCHSFSGMKLK